MFQSVVSSVIQCILFLFLPAAAWLDRILAARPGMEAGPWQRKHQALTIRPAGVPNPVYFKNRILCVLFYTLKILNVRSRQQKGPRPKIKGPGLGNAIWDSCDQVPPAPSHRTTLEGSLVHRQVLQGPDRLGSETPVLLLINCAWNFPEPQFPPLEN